MITLPRFPPPRAWLQSFWIVISLAGGAIVSILCALIVSPRWSASGAVFAVLMAVPGILRPQIASRPYRSWNRLARGFIRVARFWVSGVCFYLICATVGLAGSQVRLAKPTANESLWVSRRPSLHTASGDTHDGTPQRFSQQGWIRAYVAWARQSGNLWAVCLLPFLMILAALDNNETQNRVAANVYTLF